MRDRLLISNLHLDPPLRRNIGDRHGEKARALLLQKTGPLTAVSRALVLFARRLAFLYPAFDRPVIDTQSHMVDNGIVRQWKYIKPLDP